MPVLGLEPVSHDLPGNVRLWRVDLDRDRQASAHLSCNVTERERASRFFFEDDRRRYLAARHALRCVLGLALDRGPDELVFDTSSEGKPQLVNARGLEFNLSHSGHECLIGVSEGRPIGVDVELVRPVVDGAALARRHLTPHEFGQWESAAETRRNRVFLQAWTRKEACLKALGAGLLTSPGSLDVGCSEDTRTVVARMQPRAVVLRLTSLGWAGEVVAAAALWQADAADAQPTRG